tara:strand:+ start:31 stop:492 length:462 start_codon:yes stop_codon:yes gene_type:complete
MKYDGSEIFDKDGYLVLNLLGEEWASWPKGTLKPSYRVSTCGRFVRIIGNGWQILNPQKQRTGQVTVSVNDNGKQVTKVLKNIVADVWVDNPNQLPNIRLKDESLPISSNNLEFYDFQSDRTEKALARKELIALVKTLSLVELKTLTYLAQQL